MFEEPVTIRDARSDAIAKARNALRQSKNVAIVLTPEMLKNPSIYAHYIPLVESIAAEMSGRRAIRIE